MNTTEMIQLEANSLASSPGRLPKRERIRPRTHGALLALLLLLAHARCGSGPFLGPGTGGGTPLPPAIAPPTIDRFTAHANQVPRGSRATFIAHAYGAGINLTVDPGIGTVSYQWPFQSGPIDADTTFTLTVSGSDGPAVQKSLTIHPVTTTRGFESLDLATIGGAFLQTTPLMDGSVLVTGGDSMAGGTGASAAAQLIEVASQSIRSTGNMIHPRRSHIATLLADGRVLVAGGNSAEWNATAYRSAELFDPNAGTFLATGDMTTARGGSNLRAVRLATGEVLLVGGNADSIIPTAELYDPANGTFRPVGAPNYRHEGFSLTLLRDGQVLLVGAEDAWANVPTPAELFDPVLRTFIPTARPITFHSWHTATQLPDGTILLAGGGQFKNNTEVAPTTSAECYDPVARTFRSTGDLIATRKNHGAALLSDGRVLIAGGSSFVGPMELAEIYTPAVGTFVLTGSLASPRGNPVLVALSQGQVLVLGSSGISFPLFPNQAPSSQVECFR